MNPPSRRVKIAHVATVDLTMRFLLLGQLKRLVEEGFDVTAICAPGPWIRDVEGQGIRWIPWYHATRAWDPIADARAFAELWGILRREGFDVVHTHNPKPGIMGRIAARLQGVPHIANTVHGLYATPDDPILKRAVVLGTEAIAARCSDIELYQSEEDLSWARRVRMVDDSKGVLLGNGTSLVEFDPNRVPRARCESLRADLGIPSDAVVVGTVGRLVREKGYGEFFEAARLVRSRRPEVVFLAVGAVDPEKKDAIKKRDVEQAKGDVLFAGWREDVRDLLAIMDVFVLASWREGVPRSAIEAAAMARPMVLTDIRGCREVGRHEAEALLVPPRDPNRLAGAIERLAGDADLRTRLGTAARLRALERFDEGRVADVLLSCYRRLLARPDAIDRTTADGRNYRLRRARARDASALARIHREGLPDSFLPTLGDRFVARVYRALSDRRDAVTLVAEVDTGIVGFATGVRSVRAFYRWFYVRHGALAAILALPRVLRPRTIRRVRETASYPATADGLPDAELLSIAVDDRWRGLGIGRVLAEGVLRNLGEAGSTSVKVVVANDNVKANAFYERLGFQHRATMAVHAHRPSNVWIFECRSSSPSLSPRS